MSALIRIISFKNSTTTISDHNPDVKNHIGNKAQGLIELNNKGFLIPDSLFLDKSIYDFFCSHNKMLPNDLIGKIVNEKSGKKIAIRSSSSLEDTKTKSFAGFFKSRLNVPANPQKLKRAILESYREFQNHLESKPDSLDSKKNIYLALIIQPMIQAKYWGVLYNCPSENPDKKHFQVEFYTSKWKFFNIFGETEKVPENKILEKQIKRQDNQNGELEKREKLFRIFRANVKAIDQKYDYPVDIEFAIPKKDEQFVFLQARPITAFQFTPEFIIAQENEKIKRIFNRTHSKYENYPVLSSSNIAELFPIANPLGYSIFKTIFAGSRKDEGAIARGRQKLGYAPLKKNEQERFFVTIGNQARVNLVVDAMTFMLKGIDEKLYIDVLVKKYCEFMLSSKEKAIYPEFHTYYQNPKLQECLDLFGEKGEEIFQVHQKFFSKLLTESGPKFLESVFNKLQKNEIYYQEERELLKDKNSYEIGPLIQKLNEYMQYLQEDLGMSYVIVARLGFLSSYFIKDMMTDFVKENEANSINSPLTADNSIISSLLKQFLNSQNCLPEYRIPDYSNYNTENKTRMDNFLEIFGHLGSMDISQPRLAEINPEHLESVLEENLPRLEVDTDETILKIFLENFQKSDPEKFQLFSEWGKLASSYMTLRETFKFELLKILFLMRKVINKIAARTDFGELIYYLTFSELQKLKSGDADGYNFYLTRAIRTKSYFESCDNIDVQEIIKDMNCQDNVQQIEISKDKLTDEDEGVKGKTIHFGEAEGYCLIANTNKEYYEKIYQFHQEGIKNIIGIFKSLELSYYNLSVLTGMVTEHGGYLSHAATIARENNIPYISNVKTNLFHDKNYVIFNTKNNQIIFK